MPADIVQCANRFRILTNYDDLVAADLEQKIITLMRNARNMIDKCVVCGSESMFVRKDFPQALGVAIVVVFGLIAIYFFQVSLMKAWLALIVGGLLDLGIYLLIGKVTACYACRAEYRKCGINPAHEGFDLATSEKY